MLFYTLINGKGCLSHRGFIFLFCLWIYKENFQKSSSGLPSEHSCNVITRYILGKREHGKKDSSDDGFQIIYFIQQEESDY